MESLRWTSRDIELLPDNGKRYEVIDGELYVSKQPQRNLLESPLLPGFRCQISQLFDEISTEPSDELGRSLE